MSTRVVKTVTFSSESSSRKSDLRADGLADPVLLHRKDALGPAPLEFGVVVEKFVGVVGDAQEPLVERSLLDRGLLMTPAAAVDHLFVGEDGIAFGAPVELRFLAIGQAALVHLEKEPLIPAVVAGLTARDFGRPVVAETEAPELVFHRGAVLARPLAGIPIILDRSVLGRQTKGIPAHRMQHTEAAHAFIAGQRVPDGVVPHVPHVKRAAGVGQHFEHVVLRARLVEVGTEQVVLFPLVLPTGFDLFRVVLLLFHRRGHRCWHGGT